MFEDFFCNRSCLFMLFRICPLQTQVKYNKSHRDALVTYYYAIVSRLWAFSHAKLKQVLS